MSIYNDTTKGFKAFLLRIKDAKDKGLLGGYWNETTGKRADLLSEWYVVAGEKKHYRSTYELITDIIANLDGVTVEELEAIGDSVEAKVIHTKHKRFYIAEYLEEAVKSKLEVSLEDTKAGLDEALAEPEVEVMIEEEPKPKAKKKTTKKKAVAKK